MKTYLGLSCYDDYLATDWNTKQYDGYILGDAFCNKRMFRHGDLGLIESINRANLLNKEVIYQTPMYLTDRTFAKETDKIIYLHEKMGVKKLLVQDIGLIMWLSKNIPDIEIIWSRLGKTRNSIMNHGFIEFLQSIGISSIEVESPEKARAIAMYGFFIYSVFGSINYMTLSRDCYNKYMLNRFDGACERECNRADTTLRHQNFKMSVDGHFLGLRIMYDSSAEFYQTVKDCATSIMLYASDKNIAVKKLQTIRNSLLSEEV